MGKEENFDKSSILENLTGVEHKGAYDRDTDTMGEGYGQTSEEAVMILGASVKFAKGFT